MLKNFLGREPNAEAFLLSQSQNMEWHIVEDTALVYEQITPDTDYTDEEWDFLDELPLQIKVKKKERKQKRHENKKGLSRPWPT